MPELSLVRTGLFGELRLLKLAGQFSAVADQQVICRTERGLETGSVVCDFDAIPEGLEVSGEVLRPVNDQDLLLIERLDRFKLRAIAACEKLLSERNHSAVLLDAEHLFDGQSLFFYFLGEVSDEMNEIVQQLGETYDKKVRFAQFAEKLANGCGPGCGTTNAGCSTSACSNCSTAGGCAAKALSQSTRN
jgi:cell fate regulator YaaT (PSP1 superfamily)